MYVYVIMQRVRAAGCDLLYTCVLICNTSEMCFGAQRLFPGLANTRRVNLVTLVLVYRGAALQKKGAVTLIIIIITAIIIVSSWS